MSTHLSGTGLGSKIVFLEEQLKNGNWVPESWYRTTNADGSFSDSSQLINPSTISY